MTPQERLDQLEPLLAEVLAKQDENSAKIERVSAQVRQLILTTVDAATNQSDNIQFLLSEQADLKDRVTRLDAEIALLKAEIASLKAEIVSLKNETNQRLDRIENMVVAIYQAVQKPSGN